MPTLTAGPTTLRVDRARGGRLVSLVVGGNEVLVQPPFGEPADPLLYGSYPMAPFAGRTRGGRFRWGGQVHSVPVNLGGHAIHGTVYDGRWLIEQADDGYLRMRCDLGPRWPFDGYCRQELSLRPNQLDLRLEVHTRNLPFPATAGWHPWFRRKLAIGGSVDIDFDASRWYPLDHDGLPTGQLTDRPPERPWDDCFTAVKWPVKLTWPGALEMVVISTGSHLVVYDQQPHAVCIEPQSGPPDGLNLDHARLVRRHDPLVIEAALRWRTP